MIFHVSLPHLLVKCILRNCTVILLSWVEFSVYLHLQLDVSDKQCVLFTHLVLQLFCHILGDFNGVLSAGSCFLAMQSCGWQKSMGLFCVSRALTSIAIRSLMWYFGEQDKVI